ncbi:DUF5134 domain-containing protein [Nocardia sp. CDC153]|uniref:DUF5134 domain-containing protein n=1 Tax=Nocardia sp. CDC153 TaxID=3112167 RepID=UPI002DB9FE16|nr:DUF5134 domain-containing protein [Nocardia sp. CDC153]MEC3954021.1 DUF5134 domain-containing protein [Nocardia sp. CDC153]
MAEFVEQYGAVRWIAVVAFCLAAALVVARLGRYRLGAGECADQESDAAHLVMCGVMLGMLVFPTAVAPDAVRGVLTAMVVVYSLVLGERILRWRKGIPRWRDGISDTGRAGGGVGAFVYHVMAAAAMLYAMSGHGSPGHAMSSPGHAMASSGSALFGHGGPASGPMLALAALFTVDALVMSVPVLRNRLPRVFPHPAGAAGSLAVVPHLVMDLGTAYMLVAAAAA